MERRNSLKKIVGFFLIGLLLVLVTLLILLRTKVENEANNSNQNVIVSTPEETPKTLEEVLVEYDTELLNRDNTKLYVKFPKDLYEEKGKSNESFFYELIDDLKPFFKNRSFYLIDEDRKIDISVDYISETKEYKVIFNKVEDFFKKVDGYIYSAIDTVDIVKPSAIYVKNGYLERLIAKDMFLSSISDYLDEGTELENGYKSYNDNSMRIKLAPNKSVTNIIFTDIYDYPVLTDVKPGMSLSEIYKLHDDNAFGGLDKGYLGYRSSDLYYFFYNDEVSVYSYLYYSNKKFEKALTTYLDTGNLENFVKTLTNQILSYDQETYDVDLDIGKAYINYPTRGYEIDIRDNDPKGITLYSNYYFTDITKELLKNNRISFEPDSDSIELFEIQRRESR